MNSYGLRIESYCELKTRGDSTRHKNTKFLSDKKIIMSDIILFVYGFGPTFMGISQNKTERRRKRIGSDSYFGRDNK